MVKIPKDLPPADSKTWQTDIRNKIDSTALRANAIIDDIVRDKLLGFAAPMTFVFFIFINAYSIRIDC